MMTGLRSLTFGSLLTAITAATALTLHSFAAPTEVDVPPLQVPGPLETSGQIKPLFTQVSGTTLSTSAPERGIVRRAALTISDKTLASGVIANADAHLLNLFTDFQAVAFRSRVETRMRGDYSWFGVIPGDETGRAILTVVGGKLGAFVTHLGRDFMVLPLRDEIYEVIEVYDDSRPGSHSKDTTLEPRGSEDVRETSRTARAVGTGPLDTGGLTRWFNLDFAANDRDVPTFGPVDDDGTVIDVLIFYSHGAADLTDLQQNSVVHASPHAAPAELLARIQIAMDLANQSLLDSGVATRFNVLWSTALEAEDLIDSGDLEADLAAWQNLGSIQTAREVFAADIVLFVTGDTSPGGVVGLSGQTFFVIVWADVHPTTFAHELGHQMGLEHDWDTCIQRGDCFVPDDWTIAHEAHHGYVQVAHGAQSAVRSIMAYPTTCQILSIPIMSCDRKARWSNPSVLINNLPFGKAELTPFPSDEVGTLNDGRLFGIANRRKSACRLLSQC